jgi:hypothetical protein
MFYDVAGINHTEGAIGKRQAQGVSDIGYGRPAYHIQRLESGNWFRSGPDLQLAVAFGPVSALVEWVQQSLVDGGASRTLFTE